MRNKSELFMPDVEKSVLTSLATANFISNGASRLVYECTDYVANLLGVDAEDYVIKVAIGLAGINQNTAEIGFYLNHEYAPVAEIRAFGRFIEVMEKVDIDGDYRDFAEEECYEDNLDEAIENSDYYGLDADEAEEAYDVIMTLANYFGHTSDNGQLGRTHNGDLVAYDYGFIPGSGERQMSSIDDMLSCDDNLRNAYICGLLKLLEQDIDALDRYEKLFYERVDKDINPEQETYRYIKYVIYGFDSNNDFYKQETNYLDSVEYYVEQLPRYVVLKRECETSGLESEGRIISEKMIKTNMSDHDRFCLSQYIYANR